jgi:hypothetical protein
VQRKLLQKNNRIFQVGLEQFLSGFVAFSEQFSYILAHLFGFLNFIPKGMAGKFTDYFDKTL